MAVDFSKFDKTVDLAGLQKDIREAEENGGTGDYKTVPFGDYEVTVNKMELTTSKKGDPMVSIWFKIEEGDFKKSLLFFNQVVLQGFQFHIVNELLKGMNTGLDIHFESYTQYGQLLMDVAEKCDDNKGFVVKYEDNKGFAKYTVLEDFMYE